MKKRKTTLLDAESLRKKAEAKLENKKNKSFLPQKSEELQKLIHELQVHQIELEVTNEELRLTRDEIEIGLGEYADLYDFAPIGYFSLSLDGIITRVNLRGAAMFGIERSKLIKRSFRQFLSPDSYQEYDGLIRRALEYKIKEHCESAYIHFIRNSDDKKKFNIKIEKVTKYAHIEAVLSLNSDELRIVMVDITERKKAEISLRESEERYRRLVEFSPDPIIIHDGREIVFANKSAEEAIGGGSSGEARGKTLEDILHPDYKKLAGERITKLLRGEPVDNPVEYQIKKFDGTYFYAEISSAPVKFEGRNAVHIVARDISERKLIEQELANNYKATLNLMEDLNLDAEQRKESENALKISETKYRGLFHSIRDSILVSDTDRKIIECNGAFTTLFGYSLSEIKDKKTSYVYDNEEEFTQIGQAIKNHSDEKTPFLYTVNYRKKNGEVFPGETGVYFLRDNEGKTIGFIGLIRDISHRILREAIQNARNTILEASFNLSLDQLLTKTLDEVEILTKSKIAFFHFLESDQVTLSLQTWSTNTTKNMCTAAGKNMHYPIDQAGVWVDCVKAKSAVIHNNYASLAHRKGMPEGHATVIRQLVVPIIRDEKIVALLGVGNKENDYNNTDIETITQIADLVWDITERKRAEEKLRDSEEKFSKAFKTSPYAITITNIDDGKFIDVNEAFTKITGFTRQEALSSSSIGLQLWKNEDDRKSVIKILAEGKEVLGFEVPFHTKSGAVIKCLFSAQIIILGNKKYILSSIEDITERKLAAEKLKDTLNQLKFHIENTPLAVIEFNNEFQVRKWSKTAEKIFGWSSEEIIGLKITEIKWVHEEDEERVAKLSADMLTGEKKSNSHVTRNYTKDGKVLVCEWYNSALLDDAGNLISIHSLVLNITNRKLAEEALKEEEEKYRKLVEYSPDAVLIHKGGKIHFVNTSSLALFEAEKKEELIGKNILDLVHPDYKNVVIKRIGKIIGEQSEAPTIEEKLLTLRGNIFDAEVTAVPITLLGEKCVQVVARDITDRKKLENEIIKTGEQLRSLSNRLQNTREEERLNLSREMHDNVGQALTGLKMDIAWLQKKIVADKLKKEVLSEKLTGMNNLLDESIVTVRRIATDLRPNVLDSFGLLAAIEWQLQDLQKRSGMNCKMKCKITDPNFTPQTNLEIFRIVQESLTNVVRHSGAKSVVINVKKIKEKFIIEIIDNGKGISPAQVGGIKSLGLLGMNERAAQIGGKLKIKGTQGKGTQVTLLIESEK